MLISQEIWLRALQSNKIHTKMIKSFKKFADFVNSYRRKRQIPNEEINNILKNNTRKVLEVGCNIRPLCNQKIIEDYNIILHGIDPDRSIDLKKTKTKFEHFEITDLENFETFNLIKLAKT